MSQIDDGLIKNKIETLKNDSERLNSKKTLIEGQASADLKILGKGIEADVDSSLESNRQKKSSDSYSNSMEKIIFDEAVEKFEKYLSDNHCLEDIDGIGNFIKIEKEMFIVDLEYYKNIFSNDSVLNFIKTITVNERYITKESEIVKTGNGNKATYDKDKLYKEIKKEVDKEYDEVSKNIEAVLNIVPYNKFGIMDDYLISLDDEYFRDKTKVVAFKYGGKMTLLGHLTNIVNNDVNSDESNIFSTFPSIINTFMLTFFNKKQIKIVHPIAIYY
jgi:hypothetical protein